MNNKPQTSPYKQPPVHQPAQQHQHVKPAQPPQLPAVMQERGVSQETYNVLRNMIFPNAESVEAIAIAIDYCKARGLDIMKKPVHIVPVWDSKKGKNIETVWPSIYEYRATANRTGLYAGKDEAVFGKAITETFQPKDKKKTYNNQSYDVLPVDVTYPEYCTVTVYKIVGGQRCPFPGTVYWKEAVVMTNNQPNSMWQKRIHAQLAKCAEAEALRGAFPEELGGLAIAEEMHGQTINHNDQDIADKTIKPKTSRFAERVQQDDKAAQPEPKFIEGEVMPPEAENNAPQPKETENPATGVDDAGDAGDYSPELSELGEWDGKTIFTAEGKSIQREFKDVLYAFKYMKAIVSNHNSKAGRINVITLNTQLLQALKAANHADLVQSLHELADEGKNEKEVSHG